MVKFACKYDTVSESYELDSDPSSYYLIQISSMLVNRVSSCLAVLLYVSDSC